MKKVEITNNCYGCKSPYLIVLMILTFVILFLFIIVPIATVSFHKANPTWSESFTNPTQPIFVDGTLVKVAIAKSLSEVTQGLSDREQLEDDEGMLFIFPDTDYRTFWMKDMRFNIDMIFINEGIIVDIAKNMPKPAPWDWPATHTSKSPADAVLEINAGLSERNGWEVGDSIIYQN